MELTVTPEHLRQLMQERNLTQRETAAALEVSEEYLSRVLHGKQPVTVGMVGRVCIVFGRESLITCATTEQE